MRLHDSGASLGVTERSAYGKVTDPPAGDYISKYKDDRRNSYQIEAHQPLPEPISRERTFRELFALFTGEGQPPAGGRHR